MARRLPPDAFDVYVGFGPGRSYQAVADHFGVSKRAVTNCALREDWQARLADLERKARERSEETLVDQIEEMTQRHLKTVKVIQRKALETLVAMPLDSAMQAVRALDLALKQERALLGEGQEEGGSLEAIVRREHSRWMLREGENEDDDFRGEDDGDAAS